MRQHCWQSPSCLACSYTTRTRLAENKQPLLRNAKESAMGRALVLSCECEPLGWSWSLSASILCFDCRCTLVRQAGCMVGAHVVKATVAQKHTKGGRRQCVHSSSTPNRKTHKGNKGREAQPEKFCRKLKTSVETGNPPLFSLSAFPVDVPHAHTLGR